MIGVRLRMSGSQRGNEVTLKVCERDAIKVAQGDQFWYDIPLSDVEIIYGSQNQIELVFNTTSYKQSPIRIFKVEVFVQSSADF